MKVSLEQHSADFLRWRLRFGVFTDKRCLRPGFPRLTFPFFVTLNRFAADLLVFCLGMESSFKPVGKGKILPGRDT